MGRSRSLMTSSCSGVRIAGKDGQPGLTYRPAHTVNGKLFNQRVTFTVYVNTVTRNDQFQFVAYGALADSICRSLSNGAALDAILKPTSYLGRAFDANRAMRLEADGTPIIVRKVGFQIVESPVYGEDSQKTIDHEIATGRRPANWNTQNHPDVATWTQMLVDRSNVQYVPGSTTFGFARVLSLTGQGVVQVAQQPTGPAAKAVRLAARAGTAQPVTGTPVTGYVPPVAGAPIPGTSAAGTQPAALTTEQITALIAQITGTAKTGTTPPVATEGIDPKTGFPIATNNAATETEAF